MTVGVVPLEVVVAVKGVVAVVQGASEVDAMAR